MKGRLPRRLTTMSAMVVVAVQEANFLVCAWDERVEPAQSGRSFDGPNWEGAVMAELPGV